MGFENELSQLINRYSRENESNTPDFILAMYLVQSLEVFNRTVQMRNDWYGHSNRPGQIALDEAPKPPAASKEKNSGT